MKKIREKQLKKYLIAIVFLLLFSFASFATGADQLEPTEEIYVALFIEDWGNPYGTKLTKCILMDFNEVDGLPINTSLPAFGEYFRRTDYEVIPWGQQGFSPRISTYYDSQIGNDTAEIYTDEVCEEFLKLFDQTDLNPFLRDRSLDKATNTIKVKVDHDFFERDLKSIENLLTYKPTEGFGQLINRNFLQQFIPGNFSHFLSDLKYSLRRINANKLLWSFRIGYTISTDPEDEQEVDLNLKKLLGNSSPINHSNQRSSKIMIEIQNKNITTSEGTYQMSIENIYPTYSDKEEFPDSILFIYDVTTPIDNVIARIKINNGNKNGNPDFDWTSIIVIVVIIAIIIAIAVFLPKKK